MITTSDLKELTKVGLKGRRKRKVVKKKKKLPATFKGKSTKLGGGGRFAMIEAKAKSRGAKNPAAVAASIGRKKYGAKKMAKMAAAGRKKRRKK